MNTAFLLAVIIGLSMAAYEAFHTLHSTQLGVMLVLLVLVLGVVAFYAVQIDLDIMQERDKEDE